MSEQLKPPLGRLQAYLVAIKLCVKLFGEVLVEVKDLLVILTVIFFFVIGVYEALNRLIVEPPRSEAQTASERFDEVRK